MQRFWDARAREDPFFFVDSRLEYRAVDRDRFWAAGETDLDHLLGTLDVRVEPREVVVEIGCGVGRLTRVLAARGREVIAIDVSGEMLDRARKLHRDIDNVRWMHGDGTSLRPLPDRVADACVSHVVFQHIPDPAITLGYVREMGRVLRPGGWAAFQVSNDPGVHRRAAGARARLREMTHRAPRGMRDPAWVGAPVSLDALRTAATEGGLTVERVAGEGTQFCAVRARRVT